MHYELERRRKPGTGSRIGRRVGLKRMTPYEARQAAEHFLREGKYSGKKQGTIDLLATTGVLLEEPLLELAGISRASLKRYRNPAQLIDLIEPVPDKLQALLGRPRLRPWTLGPVGLAVAELVHGLVPKGYIGSRRDRVTHDVLCSLVCYHLSRAAERAGYAVTLHSKFAATVHDAGGTPLLEPDAMITVRGRDGRRQVFLLEYHNEEFRTRVEEKVARYEMLLGLQDESCWRRAWQLDGAGEQGSMPLVLVVWTHHAVGHRYQEVIRQHAAAHEGTWGLYLGKPVRTLLEGGSPLLWHNFHLDREDNLLTVRRG